MVLNVHRNRTAYKGRVKVDVIGPENILFVVTSVHLSAQKFYWLWH